jgi:hypothetical protein
MGKGPEVSPVVAGIIIVVVLAVVALFIYRGTMGPKGSMSADQQAKMKEYTAKMGMGTPGAKSGELTTGGAAGGAVLGGPPPNAPR